MKLLYHIHFDTSEEHIPALSSQYNSGSKKLSSLNAKSHLCFQTSFGKLGNINVVEIIQIFKMPVQFSFNGEVRCGCEVNACATFSLQRWKCINSDSDQSMTRKMMEKTMQKRTISIR